MNATVQKHLDARRLEVRAAEDEEVAAYWEKAITAYRDTSNASSSLENRLLRAYDAGRIAALAMVREAGFRSRGGEGHHYVTFDVARSLASEPRLRTALDEMNGIRALRHDVEYEPRHEVDERMVAAAVGVAERIIALGAAHLHAIRPTCREGIGSIESPGG